MMRFRAFLKIFYCHLTSVNHSGEGNDNMYICNTACELFPLIKECKAEILKKLFTNRRMQAELQILCQLQYINFTILNQEALHYY